MKIINTVYGDATGGRWQAMLNMADTLERYGHEIVLLRGEENAHLSSGERPIEVIANTGFYSVRAAFKIRKFIQQQQPDVIIAHSGKAVWLFKNAMMGLPKKVPVIAVNHSHNVKRTVRADAFIHITPHVQHLVKSLQTPHDRDNKPQQVISNLIHLPQVAAEPKMPKKPATIVMITRMADIKGIDILIKATYILAKKNIFIHVILAGDGEFKSHCEKLVKDYNLEDYIVFPGWVGSAEKIKLYETADFVAVPSLHDVQPLAVIDAFAWGKTVISSDIIGNLQVCSHAKNAWITRAGDADDLANGIQYLIENPEISVQLAQQAKRDAVQKYSFEVISEQHHNFIEYVAKYYNS